MNNEEFKSKLQQTINAIEQVELELKEKSPIVIVNNDEQEKLLKDKFLYCNVVNMHGQLKDDNTVYIMPHQIYEPKFVTLKDIEYEDKIRKGVFGKWELETQYNSLLKKSEI
jgi:hypothetical protein